MIPQEQQPQQRINHKEVLFKFDEAVANSRLSWAPTTPIHQTDNGFHFQYRTCPQFLHKPQLPDPESVEHTATSDISNPSSLHITSIPPSHNLILNVYPVLRPSYLLLTTSPTHQQTSSLDLSDVNAAWTALDRLESDGSDDGEQYMMIYNCGRKAGCSRSHKHMQLFPRPLDFVLFPDRSLDEIVRVPYAYSLVRLDPSSFSGTDITSYIFEAYISCLERARTVLGIEDGAHIPHNVVLVHGWMLVIPRRKARVGVTSANAAGMMGMVWVADEEELAEWRKVGGHSILKELGVAV
ncbi:hypothetical protein MMC12_007505 [Toensbergia leucococca]|nr:hypothetical protein [Toensbergia leucococca]